VVVGVHTPEFPFERDPDNVRRAVQEMRIDYPVAIDNDYAVWSAFDNPDHVQIVIHNYRWRLGLADGESEYAELELRLAQGPVIAVPTITLEGDANGAPHSDPSSYTGKFSGTYSHRTIEGGIGHNLPQEAPDAFADAVLEVGGRGR